MSSANRFLLTFLGRPQAHVLHAQACAAQEDDSPDSHSRRLTISAAKQRDEGCDLCIPAKLSGLLRGAEQARPLRIVRQVPIG